MKTSSAYALLMGLVAAHSGEGIDPNHTHDIKFGSSTVTKIPFDSHFFDSKHKTTIDIYTHGHKPTDP